MKEDLRILFKKNFFDIKKLLAVVVDVKVVVVVEVEVVEVSVGVTASR